MSAVIINGITEELKESVVQLLPCKIDFNGESQVESFFNVNLRSDEGKLRNSFRGRPLNGQDIELKDCIGVVFQVTPKNEENTELNPVSRFEKIRYWNWDSEPSKNDAFIKALDYFEIADILSQPVTE